MISCALVSQRILVENRFICSGNKKEAFSIFVVIKTWEPEFFGPLGVFVSVVAAAQWLKQCAICEEIERKIGSFTILSVLKHNGKACKDPTADAAASP